MLPVNKEEFWKERLSVAKKQNKLHYSVYLARQELWDNILKEHLEIFNKEIKKDDKVLDAGCGYGRMAKYFDDYVGVDLSPDLLVEAEMANPTKKFLLGDLAKLPFEDKHFDIAFCVSIKQMVVGNLGSEVWESIEKELKRVSKKLLILEYENPSNYEVI